MEELTAIVENVKQIVEDRGLKWIELSRATGIPQSTLSEIKDEPSRFKLEYLVRICNALHIPLIALCPGDRRVINRTTIDGDILKHRNLRDLLFLLRDRPVDDIIFARKMIEKLLT